MSGASVDHSIPLLFLSIRLTVSVNLSICHTLYLSLFVSVCMPFCLRVCLSSIPPLSFSLSASLVSLSPSHSLSFSLSLSLSLLSFLPFHDISCSYILCLSSIIIFSTAIFMMFVLARPHKHERFRGACGRMWGKSLIMTDSTNTSLCCLSQDNNNSISLYLKRN